MIDVTNDDQRPYPDEVVMTWQPIETAPKDGTRVLLVEGPPSRFVAVGRWRVRPTFYLREWVSTENNVRLYEVTHWMPLPEPPRCMERVDYDTCDQCGVIRPCYAHEPEARR